MIKYGRKGRNKLSYNAKQFFIWGKTCTKRGIYLHFLWVGCRQQETASPLGGGCNAYLSGGSGGGQEALVLQKKKCFNAVTEREAAMQPF